MLYISTDYVFDGISSKPFAADATKGPLNVYGLTKLFGEQAVQMEMIKYFIVRISWVFGKTAITLSKQCSAWGSPMMN